MPSATTYSQKQKAETVDAANYTLVMHFNHFTGRLEGGYLLMRSGGKGPYMNRANVLAWLTEYPDARCDPLRI